MSFGGGCLMRHHGALVRWLVALRISQSGWKSEIKYRASAGRSDYRLDALIMNAFAIESTNTQFPAPLSVQGSERQLLQHDCSMT